MQDTQQIARKKPRNRSSVETEVEGRKKCTTREAQQSKKFRKREKFPRIFMYRRSIVVDVVVFADDLSLYSYVPSKKNNI